MITFGTERAASFPDATSKIWDRLKPGAVDLPVVPGLPQQGLSTDCFVAGSRHLGDLTVVGRVHPTNPRLDGVVIVSKGVPGTDRPGLARVVLGPEGQVRSAHALSGWQGDLVSTRLTPEQTEKLVTAAASEDPTRR